MTQYLYGSNADRTPICPIHDSPTTPRLSPARTVVQHCQSCADELGEETFIVGTTTAQDRAARREREARVA